MDDYNKIIESLNIKFIRTNSLNVIKSVRIHNFYDVQNTLFLVNKGKITLAENDVATAGDIIFIPGGRSTEITFGAVEAEEINNETFINKRELYFSPIQMEHEDFIHLDEADLTNFISVTFDVKAFDSVNFFTSLDFPPFIIHQSSSLKDTVDQIYDENGSNKAGRSRIINNLTEYLIIEVFRYILESKMFVEQLATNSNYFKDSRLIDIFNYIKDNIAGDLSNKTLASVANVSEDYVGQYFKMLTGINPQDYIEYQRMEKAVDLLRTSKKSIRAIGAEVGYKDTAYFCRRFKMMFGIPAGKMRKRDSLIDI
ncbi:AraC family transcriptional regulator [Sediminitomix flava]|uniref:AraC family transcriptional regulator n=1 Tax=Sediminitomix flava TaxID=379075 RepID=UPI000D6BAB5E|nr:helix-turn-helix domain-containing protein [Sediminitomix flava]